MHAQIQHLKLVETVGQPGRGQVADPIDAIEVDHALQLELCDILETIADSLPEDVDRNLAGVAVSILKKGFPSHTALEDDVLFPLLRMRGSGVAHLEGVLKQLEHEHDTDETFAHELADELERLSQGGAVSNAEMLGYMLRGFFVSQRRHIEWENATVLPLAREVLTSGDMMTLRAAMMSGTRRLADRAALEAVREFSLSTCSGNCEDCKSRKAAQADPSADA